MQNSLIKCYLKLRQESDWVECLAVANYVFDKMYLIQWMK